MKKMMVPLLAAVMVVGIILAGCMPGAPPVTPPPVTPPPVTPPPVTPPPVTPPPVTPPETGLPFNPLKGLAIKPDGTPYKFAYVCQHSGDAAHAVDLPWWASILNRAGAEYVFYDAVGDFNLHMQQFEDAAAWGAEGILTHPMGTFELNPVATKLDAAGVAIISWDTTIYESEGVMSRSLKAHCGPDNKETAKQLGELIVDYFRQKGEKGIVAEIWGAPWHAVAQLRHAGFHEAVDPYPDIIQVIESPPGDWTDPFAMAAVEDLLTAYPEINCIFEHSDVYAEGCIEAMRVSGRLFTRDDPKHVHWTSVDGGDRGYKYVSEGYMDASGDVSDVKVGMSAWKLMFTYVCLGQPIADYRWSLIPVTLMSPENIDGAFYTALWKELPGQQDKWELYDFQVPCPTVLDPATVPPNPIPGEEAFAPHPRLITPTGGYD